MEWEGGRAIIMLSKMRILICTQVRDSIDCAAALVAATTKAFYVPMTWAEEKKTTPEEPVPKNLSMQNGFINDKYYYIYIYICKQ